MICQQKIIEFYITNRKTYNHFLKFRCTIELYWYFFFERHKCPGIVFFLQSSRCVSNEQPCFKTTGLKKNKNKKIKQLDYMMIFYVCQLVSLFYFIASVPISFSLYFPISPSPFLCSYSSLHQVQYKSFCIHTHPYINSMFIYYIYFKTH